MASSGAKLPERCRVIVLGSNRARSAKVVGILKEKQADDAHNGVQIEYLPCVANFGSYQDEQGNDVRYLISVDYYGTDGMSKMPQSLLPFFDEGAQVVKDEAFYGISGAAVGSGIEDPEDLGRIETFFRTISNQSVVLECIQPNPEFDSMHDELAAFKALSPEQKAEATRLQTIGPGKMAKFASSFARRLIDEVVEERRKRQGELDQAIGVSTVEEHKEPIKTPIPREVDPEKNRYSCRKCRTILFGEDDLQDPPHAPSRHQFSARKIHHGGSAAGSACQSLFLQNGLDWMGDMNGFEGKFSCPKCDAKLGAWNWSGAQCSCGTWVTPAIQIPNSKVDWIPPHQPELPVGTVVSSVVQQYQQIE